MCCGQIFGGGLLQLHRECDWHILGGRYYFSSDGKFRLLNSTFLAHRFGTGFDLPGPRRLQWTSEASIVVLAKSVGRAVALQEPQLKIH
jgi:hypothetical protein